MELDKYFKKGELIPAIVQEHGTGEVLMLAYMNRESRKKRWKPATPGFSAVPGRSFGNKGETSGHKQKVVSIKGDCDDDTLLVEVIQTGPACHTAAKAAFSIPLWRNRQNERCFRGTV